MGSSGSSGGMAMTESGSSGTVENPAMVFSNTYTLKNLDPGMHTVTVVLNYDNHTPFNPPVIESRTFRVAGSTGGSSGGIPTWALIAGVVVGVVAGAAGMRLIAVKA